MSPHGSNADAMTNPSVSVVVGNYNQADFVEEAIRSVAAQSYDNFECVVVDDKSTDNSVERINAVLADLKDDRFRPIAAESNEGFMANTLRGLDATSAPFIAFLDADDAWFPDFLEKHIKTHLSRRFSVAVTSSDLVVINGAGERIAGGSPVFKAWQPHHKPADWSLAGTEEEDGVLRHFFSRGATRSWLWSTNSGFMFRRRTLEAMRPLAPEKLRIGADGYWVNAAQMLGGSARLECALGYYRLHGTNVWAKNPFLGEGSELGFTPDEVTQATYSELAGAFLGGLSDMRHFLRREFLVQTLFALVGRRGAIRLSETNAEVGDLLSDWLTPRRKAAFAAFACLPKRWRPRKYR